MCNLSTAIPAGQHFGFSGRLSRRTDLRLSTISSFYFYYCSCFIFFIVLLFSLLFLLFFIIFGLFKAIYGVNSSVGWLTKLDVVIVDSCGSAIPHLQALRVSSACIGNPCPGFYTFSVVLIFGPRMRFVACAVFFPRLRFFDKPEKFLFFFILCLFFMVV